MRNPYSRVSLIPEEIDERDMSSPVLPSILSDVLIIPGDFLTPSSESEGEEVELTRDQQGSPDPVDERQRPKSFPQSSCVSRKVTNSIVEDLLFQDIPALFHSGSGKRGGVRLDKGSVQDISPIMHFSNSQSPDVSGVDMPILDRPIIRYHSAETPVLSDDTFDILSDSEYSLCLNTDVVDPSKNHNSVSKQSKTKQNSRDMTSPGQDVASNSEERSESTLTRLPRIQTDGRTIRSTLL